MLMMTRYSVFILFMVTDQLLNPYEGKKPFFLRVGSYLITR